MIYHYWLLVYIYDLLYSLYLEISMIPSSIIYRVYSKTVDMQLSFTSYKGSQKHGGSVFLFANLLFDYLGIV